MENFSRAVATLAAERSHRIEAVLIMAAQHGIELLGPIPDLTHERPTATGGPKLT